MKSILPRFLVPLAVSVALTVFGCAAAASIPQTADGTVHHVADAISNNQPQVLWQALPASYQADLREVWQGLTDQVSGDVWTQGFEVLGKVGRVLDEKQEFLQQNPLVYQRLEEHPNSLQAMTEFAQVIQLLANSQLADPVSARNIDPEAFLADVGAELMSRIDSLALLNNDLLGGEFKSEFRSISTTVIQADDNSATLEISSGEGEAKRVDFVRIEQKWVPAELANEWEDSIADARRRLEQLAQAPAVSNDEALIGTLSLASGVLDEMLAAENARDFNLSLQNLFGAVMMHVMSQGADQGGN